MSKWIEGPPAKEGLYWLRWSNDKNEVDIGQAIKWPSWDSEGNMIEPTETNELAICIIGFEHGVPLDNFTHHMPVKKPK